MMLTSLSLGLALFMLEYQHFSAQQSIFDRPTSYILTGGPSAFADTPNPHKVVAPHLISRFEQVHYWNGISIDPPELLYHSDLESNPFPVPLPGTRWAQLPVKTVGRVFNTPLKAVWHIVAPLIIALLKNRGVKYSALKTACFSTRDKDGKRSLGPIVIWIAVDPNTTSASAARDALPDILCILSDHVVEGAVVGWHEGTVEKLSGPALMRITDETNLTHHVRN